jgi:hypothetical protein
MADKQKRKSSLFGKKKLRDLSISSPHEGTFKHGIHAETSDDIFKVCSSAAYLYLCVCVCVCVCVHVRVGGFHIATIAVAMAR